MSSDSSLSPHLPALTNILEAYSRETGLSARVHAHIVGGELVDLALTHDDGNYITDPTLVQNFMNALTESISLGAIPEDCDLQWETVQVDTQSLISTAESDHSEDQGNWEQERGNPGDLDAVPYAKNDGFTLRQALLKQGHTTGYRLRDIEDSITRRGGKTLPELRFYRSTVLEGKIAEGPQGDIFSSDITSTFGAEKFADARLRLPAPTPRDVVQPKLTHREWVEIAHDTQTLYAADLAPGASGEIGQIIARSAQEPEMPYLVAHSLAQFVTGDWVERTAPGLQGLIISEDGKVWQTVTSSLEPSAEAVPLLDGEATATSFAPAQELADTPAEETLEPVESIIEEANETSAEEIQPLKENPSPSQEDQHLFKSQINTLLGHEEEAPLLSEPSLEGTEPSANQDKKEPRPWDPPQDDEDKKPRPAWAPPVEEETASEKIDQRTEPPAQEGNFMKGLRRFFLG